MKIYNQMDPYIASLYTPDDFSRILENLPYPVCLFTMPDQQHPEQLFYANQQAVDLMKLSKEELVTYTWQELFEIPVDRGIDILRDPTESGAIPLKKSPLKQTLKGFSLKVEPYPVELASGELVMVVSILNITEHYETQKQLIRSEQEFGSLFTNNPDIAFTITMDGRISSINENGLKALNYERSELINEDVKILIGDSSFSKHRHHFFKVLKGKTARFTSKLYTKEKLPIDANITAIPIVIDGKITGLIGIAQDITENLKNEALANYMAYHDVLTSLGNQRLFQEQLMQLTQEPHAKGEQSAVFLVDLDRFKSINDHLGHEVGDQVLREVATRLLHAVGDHGSVFRYAGDEFTVIVRKTNDKTIQRVAEAITNELRKPLLLQGFETVLTASIGITLYPTNAQDVKGILKSSDLAMYYAKRIGRNNYQFYSHDIADSTKNTLQINSYLHRALELDEFTLHYQPQYCSRKENLCGFEALIRWKCPHIGNVSPADFIPLAEENGLIVPIGEWVLREACRMNKEWQDTFGQFVPVSVNLSLRQFYQQDLVRNVKAILAETNLDPHYLTLEITESIAMQEEAAQQILQDLRDLGIQIAMDDFGTGYSSFKQLRYYPIDHLKIDQSFIADLTEENGEAIVGAIIALGHNLQTKVVAEGVETPEQAAILKRLGCDTLQGYYYARPQPAENIEELLANYQPTP